MIYNKGGAMKLSYPQKKSKQLSQSIQGKLSDYLCVGLDPDGNRMFGVRLDFSQRMPMRQRYDRYVGLLGQIQDVTQIIKQIWMEFSRSRAQMEERQNGEEGQGEEEQGAID